MLDAILQRSVGYRGLVLSAVVLVSGLGVWNFTRLPIDAVPDITNVQVVVNTGAPGYTPLEVEQRVTFPVRSRRPWPGFPASPTRDRCLATGCRK